MPNTDEQKNEKFDKDQEIEYIKDINNRVIEEKSHKSDDIDMTDQEDSTDIVSKLREKLKKSESEKKEYLDGWQRERADLANARASLLQEKQSLIKFSSEQFVIDLLPVLDSFDMAFANKDAWQEIPKEWRSGMEQIYAKFLTILGKKDVIQFVPLGEKFNPQAHVAIAEENTEKQEKHQTIVGVIQKGYKMHNKIIRPAGVRVAEYSPKNG
jgi:molecular chaperone GrpE